VNKSRLHLLDVAASLNRFQLFRGVQKATSGPYPRNFAAAHHMDFITGHLLANAS
jgi:hypothetical protein